MTIFKNNHNMTSMIRFFLFFICLLISLTTIWCLILATIIIFDDKPKFITLVLGLFASGGIEVVCAGVLKVIQKKYENTKKDESNKITDSGINIGEGI